MPTEDLISIIVPVFNVEGFLPCCLHSIENQTYSTLEILLVDDGSTDTSGQICDSFASRDKRVKVIHQANQGVSRARNVGLSSAQGKYLMFVDGDDYLHIDAVQTMYEAIKKYDECDVVMADYVETIRLDENIESPVSGKDLSLLSQEDAIKLLFGYQRGVFVSTMWNKLYKKSAIEGIEDRPYVGPDDFDYTLRVFLRIGKLLWVRSPLYFYVQRPGSIYNSKKVLLNTNMLDVLYDNLQSLPADNHYRHYLLQKMYRQMLLVKGKSFKSNDKGPLNKKVRDYDNVFHSEYNSCRHIRFMEKRIVRFLLRFPYGAFLLLKATKNI